MLGGLPLYLTSIAAAVAAPTLSSVSTDLFDVAGGDQLTLAGTTLSDVTSVEVSSGASWIPCSFAGNTSTSVTFTAPARTAGSYQVRVTTAGGTSNTLAIKAWAPPSEASHTLTHDSKHGSWVYNPITGLWTPRSSASPVTPGDDRLEMTSFSSANQAGNSGAPLFDGLGATRGGMKHPDNAWSQHYFGTPTSGHVAGTLWAIFDFTHTAACVASEADAVYDDPGVLITGLGTLQLSAGLRAGDNVPIVRGFIWNSTDNYKAPTVVTTQGAMHLVVLRWGLGSSSVDLSVDGAVSGGGYASRSKTDGLAAAYLAHVFRLGLTRPMTSLADQKLAGTVRAWGCFNTKIADSVITDLNKWRIASGWS